MSKKGYYEEDGGWTSRYHLFRSLSPAEVHHFKEYAEENDPPYLDRWEVYHPVCREIWLRRGIQPITQGVPK